MLQKHISKEFSGCEIPIVIGRSEAYRKGPYTRITSQPATTKLLQEARRFLDKNSNGIYIPFPQLCCICTNGAGILHSQLWKIRALTQRVRNQRAGIFV
jgi:hypothetical protein